MRKFLLFFTFLLLVFSNQVQAQATKKLTILSSWKSSLLK